MRRQLIIVIVSAVVVGLAAGPAWAQCLEYVSGVTYDISGKSPARGAANAVAVSGGFVYYNVGPTLHVADVSDPSDPRAMGELTLRGSIRAIAVDGLIASVAVGGDAGVSIVDVSNPWAPEERSFIDNRWAMDVAMSEGYVYVADGYSGLVVVDLSDPSEPVLLGRVAVWGDSRAVAVTPTESCTYAFVAGSKGLHVIDVSEPWRPVEVGSYSLLDVVDVVVSGGYAFLSADTVLVLDVSTPSTPVQVGEFGYQTFGLPPPSLAVSHSRFYLGRFPRIIVADLNPPWAPAVTCERLWDFPTGRIAWVGEYLYVPIVDVWAQRSGLAILAASEGALADFGSIEMECGVRPHRPRSQQPSSE